MTFGTVDELLEAARDGLTRLAPQQAADAVSAGDLIVDIRPEWQRREVGEVPGSLIIERNHLEWRVHPSSDSRLPQADTPRRWIILCAEGYSSSLAAHALRSLGLDAADVEGGMLAWRAAGLPIVAGPTPVQHVVAG
ncbi:rhodanese-like domain-containing protein [Nocardioides sp. CER19]|uniref:rhodanese-like domain-containing protein n=1 Tax=Nocardioides sp. CER19 TaxID=3038538 RepID=UPI002447922E|nr:rhodanese-like domain-containing protein [Nocardioides sp. CER19]MDH2415040.1 rhodanese-like domain-containing protein [Nocardioides sp. CER19]